MATEERTVRIELSYEKVLAASWAIWFSEASAPADMQEALAELGADLLKKRRQFATPGSTRAAPEPPPPERGQEQLGDVE